MKRLVGAKAGPQEELEPGRWRLAVPPRRRTSPISATSQSVSLNLLPGGLIYAGAPNLDWERRAHSI